MPGLIKREDIDTVRERADLREVVEQYVTLRNAGPGSYKGLCPFHDERTPSFFIRPSAGTYHCFGCGEHGDVIEFLRSMEHTTFSETVEQLAGKYGIELRYEDGGSGPDKHEVGRMQRLLDAHKIAEEYFREHLDSPEAQIARDFLTSRGFTQSHAQSFAVGYAPQGGKTLLGHMRVKRFSDEELKLTGMFSEGNYGLYDRFRGRLMWPIKDMTGKTVGFGGRRLHEDDQGPKYLNSPETSIYKKSQVLYGVEAAKRNIAKKRQLVVVEGYTDVMACHIAGVDTAVATCGTAFGEGHIRIVRRLLSDDGSPAEVIFTFDGDEAGQNAAMKAFTQSQAFSAQTYIAVGPEGMDPCDIRQQRGDDAVVQLVENKTPLFEFVIRRRLTDWDLSTIDGRIGALRATAPILAGIRDAALRSAYTRELAGWLGADMDEVQAAVHQAGRSNNQQQRNRQQQAAPQNQANHGQMHQNQMPQQPAYHSPDTRDPAVLMERQALEVMLQHPDRLSVEQWEEVLTMGFSAAAHQAVHNGIRIVAANTGDDARRWVEKIRQEVPEPIRGLVSELAVTSLPAADDSSLDRYCHEIINRLVELKIQSEKANLLGELQRLDPRAEPEKHRHLNERLMALERRRRGLRRVE